jgi:predicted DCC family thiol-disulfide oxidoreductase YuxK
VGPGAHRPEQAWLLWDGDCGLCRGAIEWVERRDRGRRLHAVPYQAAPRPPLSDALAAACAREVHVITPDGRVLRGARATLWVLEQIGWRRTAAVLARRPLIWLVAAAYRLVARHRHAISRAVGPVRCRVTRERR